MGDQSGKIDGYTEEDLTKFQYRSYIKTVNILLPGYQFRHTSEEETAKYFVGREKIKRRLKDFLTKGTDKGAYLITGYRGMGKTSLVKSVVDEIARESNKSVFEKTTESVEKRIDEVEQSDRVSLEQDKQSISQPADKTQKSKKFHLKKNIDSIKKIVKKIRANTSKRVIYISFGQKDIKEIDILRQILNAIKSELEGTKKYKWCYFFLNSNIFISVLSIVLLVCFFSQSIAGTITTLKDILFTSEDLSKKINPEYSESLDLNSIIALLLLIAASIGINYFIVAGVVKKVIYRRINHAYIRINDLYEKSTSNVVKEEGIGTGSDQFPIVLSKKKLQSYSIIGSKEISNELIVIIKYILKEVKISFLFVFDELDKIDSSIQSTPQYEDTEFFGYSNENISYGEHKKRKKLVVDVLASLKYLITEAHAKFIFIAGSEMFDAALADVSDRQSAISSIFGHILNIDSLYKSKDTDSNVGMGVTKLIEEYLRGIVISRENVSEKQILSLFWNKDKNDKEISKEDRLKVIYTLQHFITYVAYRSTGAPKKMIRIIEEHILFQKPEQKTLTQIFAHAEGEKIDFNKKSAFLVIGYHDQYKIGLLNYFYRPIILSKSRTMKNYSDSLLVTIPYLMDHILKFHGSAFSMENLELIPEVLSANRVPELRLFLEELIELFKQNLIRQTETKFYDYKFNYKIFNEILHVSKLFEEESAAFNFALDENYNTKVYLRLKIKELRSIYQHFGGSESGNALDSIALYNTMLGDVTYFDREYSDAIGCYMDALVALQNNDVRETKLLSMNNMHFVSYVKCLMKLGLSYEKIKAYDKAISCYLDTIDVIGKNQTLESKFFLKKEIERYLLNAVFSCLFIYEKNPASGSYNALIESLSQRYGFYYPNNKKRVLKFKDYLTRISGYHSYISLLFFYQNGVNLKIENDPSLKSLIYELSYLCKKIKTYETASNPTKEESLMHKLEEESISFQALEDNLLESLNYLFKKYQKKSIKSEDSYFTARILSRLGNVCYSHYLQDGNSDLKSDLKEIFNMVSSIPYAVFNAIDCYDGGEQEQKKIILTGCYNIIESFEKDPSSCIKYDEERERFNSFPLKNTKDTILDDIKAWVANEVDSINSSDLIKTWIFRFYSKSTQRNKDSTKEDKGLCPLEKIFYIYLLSAKLYMLSGNSLMASHQYRKILSILRSFSATLKTFADERKEEKTMSESEEKTMSESEAKLNVFLNFLKITLVKRSLQVASWNSTSTDRSQVYKYKHSMYLKEMKHQKKYAKFTYKSLSNATDLKEALWHYVVIDEVCKAKKFENLKEVLNNPNQSLIYQGSIIHTMHARLNELSVQYVINRNIIDLIYKECFGSEIGIDRIYKEIRSIDSYSALKEEIDNAKKGDFLSLLKGLKGDGNKLNLVKQMSYVIANQLYSIHNILLILQTKGISFLFTYSIQADYYKRLGDTLKYYELLKVLKEVIGDQHELKEGFDVFKKTEELIGDYTIRSMDTTSSYQLATRYYRKALDAHTGGSSYRYLISNMCFLEDDFHDNVFHFSMAFERQRINSGKIIANIRKISYELNSSQFFDYESHINGEPIE